MNIRIEVIHLQYTIAHDIEDKELRRAQSMPEARTLVGVKIKKRRVSINEEMIRNPSKIE